MCVCAILYLFQISFKNKDNDVEWFNILMTIDLIRGYISIYTEWTRDIYVHPFVHNNPSSCYLIDKLFLNHWRGVFLESIYNGFHHHFNLILLCGNINFRSDDIDVDIKLFRLYLICYHHVCLFISITQMIYLKHNSSQKIYMKILIEV